MSEYIQALKTIMKKLLLRSDWVFKSKIFNTVDEVKKIL